MTAPIEYTAQLRIPACGPMFDGHFPDYPVLPGARLLDLVITAIDAGCDDGSAAGSGSGSGSGANASAGVADTDARTGAFLQVHVAKFLSPVAPGAVLRLAWRVQAGGRISFECHDGTRRVASGTLSRDATQHDAPAQEPQR